MIKKLTLGALVVVIGAILSIGVYGQDDMVVVDNSVFDSPRRPPAQFAHDEHNDKAALDDCALCHHLYDKDGQLDVYDSSEDQSCSECHAIEDQGPVPGLRKAFHQRCRGCHLTQSQGPVVCAQCHPRTTLP